ncbi:MAG: tetratricopeptide repeat protein [bacterium]
MRQNSRPIVISSEPGSRASGKWIIILVSLIFTALFSLGLFGIKIFLGGSGTAKHLLKSGDLHVSRGEYIEAIIKYKKILRSDSLNYRAKLALSKAMLALSWQNFNKNHWRDYAKNPDDYMEAREMQLAVQYLKECIQKNPGEPDAHFYLGRAYEQKGWFEKAQFEYELALKNKPDYLDALISSGVVLMKMGRPAVSQQYFEKILSRYPDNPQVLLNLGSLNKYHLKNDSLALMYWLRFLKAEPHGPESYFIKEELLKIRSRHELQAMGVEFPKQIKVRKLTQ